MHTIPLPILIAFIVSFAASASRIFTATKPFWGRFPAWLQVLAPTLPPFFAAIQAGASGSKSWTDLTVVFIGAGALLLPGLPSHRSSAPLPSNPKPPSVPPMALVGLLAFLALTGCGLFSSSNPIVPTVEKCAPATQSVVNEVAQILLAGGDYEKALEDLAKKYTENMVVCVVNSLVKQWGEPTAKRDQAHVAARARGQAYLAEKAPQ